MNTPLVLWLLATGIGTIAPIGLLRRMVRRYRGLRGTKENGILEVIAIGQLWRVGLVIVAEALLCAGGVIAWLTASGALTPGALWAALLRSPTRVSAVTYLIIVGAMVMAASILVEVWQERALDRHR